MKHTFLILAGFALFASRTIAQTTVTDYDGNVYNTVIIGTQEWQQENLKVTHYRNGDVIPNVTGNSAWINLTTGAYCDYDNLPGNSVIYGALYNWYTVDDPRNLCPSGWHVPADTEWKTLEMFLGMSQLAADVIGWRGTDEGGKLKESGYSHWLSPNTGATNSSNFTALPGGYRAYADGSYTVVENNAEFWCSTQYDSVSAYDRELWYGNATTFRGPWSLNYGIAVRCIKDSTATIINEMNNNDNIQIYPNPVNDIVCINYTKTENAKMKVVDIVGKCVFECDLRSGPNDIDVSKLSKGVYLIQINSDNWTIQKKLTKE